MLPLVSTCCKVIGILRPRSGLLSGSVRRWHGVPSCIAFGELQFLLVTMGCLSQNPNHKSKISKPGREAWSVGRGRVPTDEIVAFESGCGFLACSDLSARRFRVWGRFRDSLHSVPDVGGMCLVVLLQLNSERATVGVRNGARWWSSKCPLTPDPSPGGRGES